MTTTTPPSQTRRVVIALSALLLALAIPTTILLIADGSDDATSGSARAASQQPVMPGHGSVMPTDVRVSAKPSQLVVAVGDYWFKPSARRLRAGKYELTARSYASIPHDVMLERAPIAFEMPGHPADAAAPYGVEDLTPRIVKTTRDVVLGPGRWILFCSLSGHYTAGQAETIDVYGELPRGLVGGKAMVSDEM